MSNQLILNKKIVNNDWVFLLPVIEQKEVKKQAGKVVMFKVTGENFPEDDDLNKIKRTRRKECGSGIGSSSTQPSTRDAITDSTASRASSRASSGTSSSSGLISPASMRSRRKRPSRRRSSTRAKICQHFPVMNKTRRRQKHCPYGARKKKNEPRNAIGTPPCVHNTTSY